MNKIRNFAHKHTVLFSFILVVIIMLLYNYCGYIIPIGTGNQVLSLNLSLFKVFLAVLTVAYLMLFKYAPISILQVKHLKKSLTICSPLIAMIGIEFLITFIASYENVDVKNFVLFIIGLLGIGIFEEFLFRVGVLQILLSKWHNSKKELERAAIGSGIFFGAVHLTNILSGNATAYVIGQCVLAAIIGYMLSILYIVTKNIWGCVIFHAVFDSVSTFNLIFGKDELSETVSDVQYSLGTASDSTLKNVLMVVGFYVVVILFSLVMLRIGKKLLYLSEELATHEDRTKTDEFLMHLLKIEDYPK